MQSQRNKYVWTKCGQPSRSNYGNMASESQSRYQFRRNTLKSHSVYPSTSIMRPTLPNTTDKAYHINYASMRGFSRAYSRRISSKLSVNSGSRYKYLKTLETTRSQATARIYSPPSSISRNCAKRTLYKYVRGYCNGSTPKTRGEILTIAKRITNNAARYSPYRYARKRGTCSTARASEGAKVMLNSSTKRGISHVQPLNTASKLKESLTFRRKPMCTSYIMNGMCDAGNDCVLNHDENYIRICPRYLHHRCSLGRFLCPLAHVLDPCRLPVCEFYAKSDCDRVNCPYLHTSRSPGTPICPEFQRGRCPRGRTCSKLHVWLTKNSRKDAASKRRVPTSRPLSSVPSSSGVGQENDNRLASEPPSSTSEAPLFISLALPATPAPEGSLRHVFPPPNFIPLLDDEEI